VEFLFCRAGSELKPKLELCSCESQTLWAEHSTDLGGW